MWALIETTAGSDLLPSQKRVFGVSMNQIRAQRALVAEELARDTRIEFYRRRNLLPAAYENQNVFSKFSVVEVPYL